MIALSVLAGPVQLIDAQLQVDEHILQWYFKYHSVHNTK